MGGVDIGACVGAYHSVSVLSHLRARLRPAHVRAATQLGYAFCIIPSDTVYTRRNFVFKYACSQLHRHHFPCESYIKGWAGGIVRVDMLL